MRLRLVTPTRSEAMESFLYAGIVREARKLGADAAMVSDVNPDDEGDEVYVVVPERFYAESACTTRQLDARGHRTLGLVTAPGPSELFNEGIRQAARCRAIFTTSSSTLGVLHSAGMDARFLSPGYTDAWDLWNGSDSTRRESFHFESTLSARLGRLLAGLGESMWDQRWSARFAPDLSLRSRRIHRCEGLSLARELADSRVLLDLSDNAAEPADDFLYALAAINGAVILTERTVRPKWMVPGRNCLVMPGSRAVHLLPGLSGDDEVLGDLRCAAREAIQEHGFSSSVESLLFTAEETLEPSGVFDPPRVAERCPEDVPIEGGWSAKIGSAELLGASIRRVEGKLLGLQRAVERLQLGLDQAAPSPTIRVESPTYASPGTPPRVSVLVSLYNYGGVVAETLESVSSSVGVAFELIVQDDGSTDASFNVVRDFIERHPDVPILGIRHQLNQGLSATRNDLLAEARGEYVFSLDADNGVFPSCLARLSEALDRDSDAAFAYSMIANRELRDYTSLSSAIGWDPQFLRRGNYIDAMAMLRTSSIRRLGGWDTSMMFGWEDFQVWARFAEAGEHAVFVPQVLSWYRKSNVSMIMGSRVDEMSLWAQVRNAAPHLMTDFSEEEAPS